MCLAIVNIKGTIPRQSLLNAWQSNPDGGGLLYISGEQLKDFKELKDFNKFYNFYINLRVRRNKKTILIHFRWATAGKVDIANCHPFYVDKKLGFIHNGIISGVGVDPNKSDTVLFNKTVLQAFPENFLDNRETVDIIAENIGNSKLCFMDNNGEVKIINERLGHWYEENWYSNNSYRDHVRYSSSPATYLNREPSIFAAQISGYEDEADWGTPNTEMGCINCGSKHASFDEEMDCFICNRCRETFLT